MGMLTLIRTRHCCLRWLITMKVLVTMILDRTDMFLGVLVLYNFLTVTSPLPALDGSSVKEQYDNKHKIR